MTLPEVCECNERPENIMPNTNSTSATAAVVVAAGSGLLSNSSSITTTTTAATTTTTTGTGSVDDNGLPLANLGEALKALLRQAAAQGRVTCSLTSCVDLLSTRPDDVMLCVMPVLPHPDAAATIQSTLIRAVCLEHNIRVLTVDCDVKLAKTVVGSAAEDAEDVAAATAAAAREMRMDAEEEEEVVYDNCNNVVKMPSACSEDVPLFFTGCDNLAPVMGFPCVLVRYPADGTSKEDELVAEFCKEQLFGHTQQDPYIELPD